MVHTCYLVLMLFFLLCFKKLRKKHSLNTVLQFSRMTKTVK